MFMTLFWFNLFVWFMSKLIYNGEVTRKYYIAHNNIQLSFLSRNCEFIIPKRIYLPVNRIRTTCT